MRFASYVFKMKIRTDFVTNSSSSSFVTIYLLNAEGLVRDTFDFDRNSTTFGNYNEMGFCKKTSNGLELIKHLSKYFGTSDQFLENQSKRIKDIDYLNNCFITIEQKRSFDDGNSSYTVLLGFARGGYIKSIVKTNLKREIEYDKVLHSEQKLVELLFFSRIRIEWEIVFDGIPNIEQSNAVLESCKIGDLLDIDGDYIEFNDIRIGRFKTHKSYRPRHPHYEDWGTLDLKNSFLPMTASKYFSTSPHDFKAEIIECVPLSKRRKGSKYPLLRVTIKPQITPEAFLNGLSDYGIETLDQ